MRTRPRGRKSAKTCFVASVISEEDTPTRKRADLVLKRIVMPALKARGLRAIRIDRVSPTGSISEAIVENLVSSDLMIADLSFLNPNVMFELGIRHAWCLPVIPIAQRGTKLPFDITDMNTVFYGDPEVAGSCRKARGEIGRRIRKAEKQGSAVLVFGKSFEKASRPLRRRFIRDAAVTPLRDLVASLRDRAQEIEEEIAPDREDALSSLARLIRTPVKSLSDKWNVLAGIADEGDREFAAFMRKGKRLFVLARALDRKLLRGPRTRRTLDQARSRVNRMITVAKRMLRETDAPP